MVEAIGIMVTGASAVAEAVAVTHAEVATTLIRGAVVAEATEDLARCRALTPHNL
jgi:hypothetical protein